MLRVTAATVVATTVLCLMVTILLLLLIEPVLFLCLCRVRVFGDRIVMSMVMETTGIVLAQGMYV